MLIPPPSRKFSPPQKSWESKGTPPQSHPPQEIAGLIKGNQWVFIVPDHKAGYFFGGFPRGHRGGVNVGPLDSQPMKNFSVSSDWPPDPTGPLSWFDPGVRACQQDVVLPIVAAPWGPKKARLGTLTNQAGKGNTGLLRPSPPKKKQRPYFREARGHFWENPNKWWNCFERVQRGWHVISQQFRYIEMHMSNDPSLSWR